MIQDKIPPHIRLDERNHVEKPLLDQLEGLGWEIINLDRHQAIVQPYLPFTTRTQIDFMRSDNEQ
jgi:type I restriction enzyme R subunit